MKKIPMAMTGLLLSSSMALQAVEPMSVEPDSERRPFAMSVKTNMLYDLLALPNIGAEVYLGQDWSVAADWMYGWWSNRGKHRYWRAYGGNIGVRWWISENRNASIRQGHHLGVSAGVVTYDFEWGGTGYMGGRPHGTLWDRCNYTASVEYGYALPVSRRLNLDFSIGVGYLGGRYIKYEPQGDNYVCRATRRLNWVGPVKLEIALVWLLGRDNYNSK